MPLYHYRALNLQGQYHYGDWFGSSKQHLYQHLKQQRLQLLSCQTIKKKGWGNFFLRHVDQDDLVEFCIHMQEMDKAKISLSESILLFAENYTHRCLKSVLVAIYHSLQQGLLLSQACQLYPWVFNSHFVDCLAIAEKTGEFSTAFAQLETYLIKRRNYHQQLKQAIRYPLILMGSLIVILGILGGIFLPQLQTHLEHLGSPSTSLASSSLIKGVNFFTDYGYYISLIFIGSLSIIYCLYKTSQKAQKYWDKIVLKIPVVGTFKKKLFINQFAQTLSLLLNADINLLNSLEKATTAIPNSFLKAKFSKVFKDVQTGTKLSEALKKRHLISPLFGRYIQLGEETGNLGPLIHQAAEADLKNIWRRLNNLLAWAQPILIMFIGGIFIWIVMATILPLYDNLSFLES